MKAIYLITRLFLLVGIVLCFLGCNNNAKSNNSNKSNESKAQLKQNEANNPYEDLRNLALATTPEQLNLILPKDKTIVYGVVMDWDLGEGIATLAVFQTGDASLYTSTGGGVIGGGYHENVKKSAVNFIKKSQTYLNKATNTDSTSLSATNSVHFYFLTNKGKFSAQEQMKNFDNNSSQWLELFKEANKVISELRQVNKEGD